MTASQLLSHLTVKQKGQTQGSGPKAQFLGPRLPPKGEAPLTDLGQAENPSLFQHQQYLSHHKNKLYQGQEVSTARLRAQLPISEPQGCVVGTAWAIS